MNKKKIKDNLLKAVKQAILQEAVQGKLTEDWRVKSSPPDLGGVSAGRGGFPLLGNLRGAASDFTSCGILRL